MEAKTAAVTRSSLIRSDTLQKFIAFGGLIILFIVYSLASPFFLTPNNIGGILLAASVNGILALGVTFVIINGGIDLSVGAVMAFSSVMTAQVMIIWQQPVLVGILAGILTGALCGTFNGLMVTKMKMPPFVATLGMLYITKGMSLVVAQLKPIYFNDAPVFNEVAMGSVLGSIVPTLDPIKNVVLVFLGAAAVAAFILGKTILGRYTFALGSNIEATRLSGVNVDRWQTSIFMLCGLFAGLAGVVMGARLNSAQPALGGAGYELDAIAAAVIGGTSLSGGEGSILGTMIGALFIATLANGLRVLGVQQEYQIVVTGTVLVLAVFLDRFLKAGKSIKFNFKVYFSTKGRISRQTWWIAAVVLYVIALILGLLFALVGNSSAVFLTLFYVVDILLVAAYIVIGIKRLHDQDKSGWFWLISLVPLIGSIILFIMLGFIRGTDGPNEHGDVSV